MTSENDQITFDRVQAPRRTVIKSAAWGLPIVAAAAAIPLAAATTETNIQVNHHTGRYTYMNFSNASFTGHWQTGTSLTMAFRMGAESPSTGPLSYSSDEMGVTVTTSEFVYSLDIPWRLINWSTVSGWTISESNSPVAGYMYRYTFTPNAAARVVTAYYPLATTAIDGRPGPNSTTYNVWNQSNPRFTATATNHPFSNGVKVVNGPSYTFKQTRNLTYTWVKGSSTKTVSAPSTADVILSPTG